MKTWYNLKATDAKATMSIFDEIGAYGVSAKNFLNDLRSVKASAVDVEINSPGGDVFAGIAIYNGLRASGKTINVKIMGIAASAASLIAMAGDSIEMPSNSMMMIHNPWSFAMGNAEDMRDQADVLDKIGMSLVSTYAKRTGMADDKVKALLDAETYMTAEEAVEMGFATKVTELVAAKAQFDMDRLPAGMRDVFKAALEEPVADPVVEPVTDPEPILPITSEPLASSVADEVAEVAQAAGLAQFTAMWVADPAVQSVADARVLAQQAKDILAVCKYAGLPDMADGMVRSKLTVEQAREKVFAALSEGQEIDTSPKASKKPTQGAQPSAVKTADIWAARRKQTTGV